MISTAVFANEEADSAPSAETVSAETKQEPAQTASAEPAEQKQEQESAPVQESQTEASSEEKPTAEQTEASAAETPAEEKTAEEKSVEEPLQVLGTHADHAACGMKDCAASDHPHDGENASWIEIKQSNISALCPTAGFKDGADHYFYLGEDVTASFCIIVGQKGLPTNVHLCLNGHTITVTDVRLFSIYSGTATVCDCQEGGRIESKAATQPTGAIVFWQQPTKGDAGATFDLYGGTLTYAANASLVPTHGMVYVTNEGVFNMFGGTLDGADKGTKATNGGGGGITVAGSGTPELNIHGGAIYCRSQYKKAVFDNLDIYRNFAKVSGGAIYALNEMDFNNCRIHNNEAGNHGGVLYVTTCATINFNDCHIYENKCKNDGGALWTYGFTELNNCLVENNKAGRDGGAIHNKVAFNFDSYVKLNEGTVICGNQAGRNGGAVSTVGAPTLTEINGAEIYGNKAGNHGGGIFCTEETKFTMLAGSIHNNTCYGNGGGLYGQGNVKLLGGQITDNTCGGIGGGAYLSNEISDSGSLQHNNFSFGAIKITDNHAKIADSVYMTKTAAGMIYNGVLPEGADFTIKLETNRDITKLLQGSFDYQKVGENTYRITAASNALRPTEIDANGNKHFNGEVVDPKTVSNDYETADGTSYEVIKKDLDEDDEDLETENNLQDADDTSSQEQAEITVFSAGVLTTSALAAALILKKRIVK